MNTIAVVSRRLEGFSRHQCALLSMLCAQSVFPIIERFGDAATQRAAHLASNDVACYALSGLMHRTGDEWYRLLSELPESAEDDSHRSAFMVMKAVSVHAYAALVTSAVDFVTHAKDASGCSADIYADVDIGSDPSGPRVVHPLRLPKPGMLESMQLQMQADISETLCNSMPGTLDTARSCVLNASNAMRRQLDDFARHHGW